MDGSRFGGEAAVTVPLLATPVAWRELGVGDWVGFCAMAFGMFMALLDIQIVSSSLAEIQSGLAAGADEISWVQTSYLIAEVVMIPLSGFLSRALGTRLLFAVSAASFTLMSVACGFAWNLESMIVFRAAQGFLGGAMIPTVFATSFTLFPPEKRAGVGVLIGLIATAAPTLGPTVGGYLTEAFSWHWLFLINLMPGIAVALTVWLLVDVDRPNLGLLKGFDYAGFTLMALFLGSLEYVMEEGPRNDWFEDRVIFAFAVICAVAGAFFLWRMLIYRNPIVELRAFADRNFAVGSLYSFILGVGLYGAVYIVPLYLARVRGFNSLQIGEVMFVTGFFQMLSAPIAGALSKKLDLRLMLALGLGLFGVGVYLTSFMTAEWGFWELMLPQAVRGSSLMLCFLPINTLALGTLPPEKLKNASGLYNLMRNLGGAIGLAAINTVITDRQQFHWNRLAARINPGRGGVQSFLDTFSAHVTGLLPGDPNKAAMKELAQIVYREATVLTFNDVLLLMAGVFALALMLMPLVRRPQVTAIIEAH